MPILNYTTSVAVAKTLGEIQASLARQGARSILVEYDASRQPSGMAFVIPTRFGDRLFRLPANVAGVQRILEQQWADGKIAPRFATPEHAARVGWRILKDWVEAQVAIIEAGMVTLDEVMLPYLELEEGGSVYNSYVAHGLKLLPEGKTQ